MSHSEIISAFTIDNFLSHSSHLRVSNGVAGRSAPLFFLPSPTAANLHPKPRNTSQWLFKACTPWHRSVRAMAKKPHLENPAPAPQRRSARALVLAQPTFLMEHTDARVRYDQACYNSAIGVITLGDLLTHKPGIQHKKSNQILSKRPK